MQRMYPERLAERYRLTEEELGQDAYDLLETVGRKRGMLMSGGVVNTERAAITLVDEFRGAKLGRVFAGKAGGSMTEELYAFDAEYRARAGVVCGVDVGGPRPVVRPGRCGGLYP